MCAKFRENRRKTAGAAANSDLKIQTDIQTNISHLYYKLHWLQAAAELEKSSAPEISTATPWVTWLNLQLACKSGRLHSGQSAVIAVLTFNPLEFRGSYSATPNNMKLVHWQLMGGLLLLVQQGGDWVGPQPTQAPPDCTKCNSPTINGQCTNHRIAVNGPLLCGFNVSLKG